MKIVKLPPSHSLPTPSSPSPTRHSISPNLNVSLPPLHLSSQLGPHLPPPFSCLCQSPNYATVWFWWCVEEFFFFLIKCVEDLWWQIFSTQTLRTSDSLGLWCNSLHKVFMCGVTSVVRVTMVKVLSVYVCVCWGLCSMDTRTWKGTRIWHGNSYKIGTRQFFLLCIHVHVLYYTFGPILLKL